MGTGHATIRKKKACYAHHKWPTLAICIARALPAPCSVPTQLGLMHIAGPGLVLALKWPGFSNKLACSLVNTG